ncbi:uncharacterized protein LOC124293228 [Neodiprion lecontei]|uniref:Uncharacterized protein LOC124293228 n=1 Tax=Neodiprion lecontei TaxID=441921 RepID=A0ABM3FMH4_NEOLC|nr:uncharacterized protein LOC124293228 [Neodiprion lecontei]
MFMKIVVLTAVLAIAHDVNAAIVPSYCDNGTQAGLQGAIDGTMNNVITVLVDLGLGNSDMNNTLAKIQLYLLDVLNLVVNISGSSSTSSTSSSILNLCISILVKLLNIYIDVSLGGNNGGTGLSCDDYSSAVDSYNSSAISNMTSMENQMSNDVYIDLLGLLVIIVNLVVDIIVKLCITIKVNLLGLVNVDADVNLNAVVKAL